MIPPPPPRTCTPSYYTPTPDDGIARLIPYRNVPALVGYYLGVFSIFPVLGVFLGIAAVVLGILGLKNAARDPSVRGKAHAITAIVCGTLFGLFWLAADILLVIALATHR